MINHLFLYKGRGSLLILSFTSSTDTCGAALVILAIALFSRSWFSLFRILPQTASWYEELGAQDRSVTCRCYQRIADLRVSTTDPDATIMLHKDGSHLGYQTHYVVDGGTSRIILTVLVTPAEVMENQPMLDLIWRARFRWKLWPRQVTGDSKYGTEENIVALEDQHIRAYVPLPDLTRAAPLSFVKRSSTMTQSAMCTCVRQAKNCVWIG